MNPALFSNTYHCQLPNVLVWLDMRPTSGLVQQTTSHTAFITQTRAAEMTEPLQERKES